MFSIIGGMMLKCVESGPLRMSVPITGIYFRQAIINSKICVSHFEPSHLAGNELGT